MYKDNIFDIFYTHARAQFKKFTIKLEYNDGLIITIWRHDRR